MRLSVDAEMCIVREDQEHLLENTCRETAEEVYMFCPPAQVDEYKITRNTRYR